jgi:hypothetical protein
MRRHPVALIGVLALGACTTQIGGSPFSGLASNAGKLSSTAPLSRGKFPSKGTRLSSPDPLAYNGGDESMALASRPARP